MSASIERLAVATSVLMTVLCWNVNGKTRELTKKKKIVAYDPVIAAIIEPRGTWDLAGYSSVEAVKAENRI